MASAPSLRRRRSCKLQTVGNSSADLQKNVPAQTPNSMGRNTWAEKLHALLLSNCTLRYLVLMAAAHMTCYQHFISKTSMANAVRSKSGPGALSVGAQRSLSEPGGLSLGPGAFCIRARRAPAVLCRGAALSVLGSSALCRGYSLAVCVGPSPQLRAACSFACYPSGPRAFNSDPCVAHPVRGPPAPIRAPVRSACHPALSPIQCRAPPAPIRVPPIRPSPQLPAPGPYLVSDPRATHPDPQTPSSIQKPPASFRVAGPSSPAAPQLRAACHPSGPARSPFFQESTPNLTVWGKTSQHKRMCTLP